jgi:hypothetical protein
MNPIPVHEIGNRAQCKDPDPLPIQTQNQRNCVKYKPDIVHKGSDFINIIIKLLQLTTKNKVQYVFKYT